MNQTANDKQKQSNSGGCITVFLICIIGSWIIHYFTTPDPLVGNWSQYTTDGLGESHFLGRYHVEKSGGAYTMTCIMSNEFYAGPSYGIYNINFSGGEWTFDSNWGGGNIAHFVLHQQSNGTFTGLPTVNGEPVPGNLNVWSKDH